MKGNGNEDQFCGFAGQFSILNLCPIIFDQSTVSRTPIFSENEGGGGAFFET
jgi:hypothetical protein